MAPLLALLLFGYCAAALGVFAYSRSGAKGIAKIGYSLSDCFLFFFLCVCVLLGGAGMASIVENSLYGRSDWAVFAPTASLQLFAIAGIFVFGKYSTFGGFGFFRSATFADAMCGVKYFLMSLLVMPFAILLSYYCLKISTGETPQQQEVIAVFRSIKDWKAIALAIFSIVVLAPIAEELFFRGALYGILRDGLFGEAFMGRFAPPEKAAAFLSAVCVSLIFAAIHRNALAFFPLFTMGMMFVGCYAKRGSILSAIVFHGLFNALNVALILGLGDLASNGNL
ncbi:MAG: hypothetical protein DBX55_01080 [Verrucomicrobia bacterium]|nr:MAG: hypothetical protein DBX55_01080 [Verrucomicrobiota bacterium]